MSQLLRQQSGDASLHLVLAGAIERHYSQGRRALSARCAKYAPLGPPTFETDTDYATIAELHDKKHQPDLQNGGEIGIPLDKFINDAYEGLAAGKEEVTVGDAQSWYAKIEPARQEIFHMMLKQ